MTDLGLIVSGIQSDNKAALELFMKALCDASMYAA